jgi:hypothetical protein
MMSPENAMGTASIWQPTRLCLGFDMNPLWQPTMHLCTDTNGRLQQQWERTLTCVRMTRHGPVSYQKTEKELRDVPAGSHQSLSN